MRVIEKQESFDPVLPFEGLPACRQSVTADLALRRRISKVLRDLGVPEHLSGYRYLAEAVVLVSREPAYLRKMTTLVYPYVAKKYHTTACAVERAMRHAIESAWLRSDPDVLLAFFGNTIDPDRGKPVNSEFIARISSAVCQEVLS